MHAPAPQDRTRRTAIFIAIVVLANSFGNLLLAIGMKNMPDFDHVSMTRYIVGLILNPTLVGGAALTAIFTFAQLSLFSWADLSYVIPCTASAYILTTLFGQVFMGEHVGLTRWIGVVLISFGVTLVAETPIATVEHQAEVKQC
ncbi:MAG TPA: hypothetical protein VJS11_09310 [Acidobacteriaceae bacterium]|nr:hypothetical protein [Acidobacteriaceae bacterium]